MVYIFVVEARSGCGKVYAVWEWLSTARRTGSQDGGKRTRGDGDKAVDKLEENVEKWTTTSTIVFLFPLRPHGAAR